jgi:hypothetical protein
VHRRVVAELPAPTVGRREARGIEVEHLGPQRPIASAAWLPFFLLGAAGWLSPIKAGTLFILRWCHAHNNRRCTESRSRDSF